MPASVDIAALVDSGLVTLLELVEGGVDKAELVDTVLPGGVTITEGQLVAAGLFDPMVSIVDLVASGLATISDLVGAGLVISTIDMEELILLNLVTGEQLVQAGLMTQGQLNSHSYPSVSTISLINARLEPSDATSHIMTVADLVGQWVLQCRRGPRRPDRKRAGDQRPTQCRGADGRSD